MSNTQQTTLPTLSEQATRILKYFAGHVATEVIRIGIETDLFPTLATFEDGVHLSDLANQLGLDEEYLQIWAEAAYGFELIDLSNKQIVTLKTHLSDLLVNTEFAGYIGGMAKVLTQPEIFGNFSTRMQSGERIWWDQTSPTWIDAVIESCRPMYTRFFGNGIHQIDGLHNKLKSGARILELASGGGRGTVDIATQYPNTTIDGVDGDAHSIKLGQELVREQGLEDRIQFTQSSFEEFSAEDTYDFVFINASMHECRDIEQVTKNVYRSLKSGGIFVISDFPFPTTLEEYKTLPGQLMLGINFYESQIDDRLLPNNTYIDLLEANGFQDVRDFNLTGTHSVIYGTKS